MSAAGTPSMKLSPGSAPCPGCIHPVSVVLVEDPQHVESRSRPSPPRSVLVWSEMRCGAGGGLPTKRARCALDCARTPAERKPRLFAGSVLEIAGYRRDGECARRRARHSRWLRPASRLSRSTRRPAGGWPRRESCPSRRWSGLSPAPLNLPNPGLPPCIAPSDWPDWP